MSNINQIGVNGTVYDIEAKALDELQNINFRNNQYTGTLSLNEKGNLALESLSKHVNIESAQSIQLKPTNSIILDTGRRIVSGKGNEASVVVKFDDIVSGDYVAGTYPDDDEAWGYLKVNARAIDLRCNDHGGIALQPCNKDSHGNENKIKFESSRTSSIDNNSAAPAYSTEGGKGLEFATFNNEHTSIYSKDYRFRAGSKVYAVNRGTVAQTGEGTNIKIDYPTQGDDFKDILRNEEGQNCIYDATSKEWTNAYGATWAEIVNVARKYADGQIGTGGGSEEGGSLDPDIWATKSYVSEVINNLGTETYPIVSLLNKDALEKISIGSSKGNFQIDVTGNYTYEANISTVNHFGTDCDKGFRIVSSDNFYSNADRVYFTSKIATTNYAGETVEVDTVINNDDLSLSAEALAFYRDPSKYCYKALVANAEKEDGTTVAKKTLVTSWDDESYYISHSDSWEVTPYWKEKEIWSRNDININLETDSKIKLAGNKIEILNTKEDEYENSLPMESITINSNLLDIIGNNLNFSKKITKNGDINGTDTIITYTYTNNVSDTTVTPDLATFIINYKAKHTNSTLSDAEIEELYDELVADTGATISVKISELLGLVNRVAILEAAVAELQNNS